MLCMLCIAPCLPDLGNGTNEVLPRPPHSLLITNTAFRFSPVLISSCWRPFPARTKALAVLGETRPSLWATTRRVFSPCTRSNLRRWCRLVNSKSISTGTPLSSTLMVSPSYSALSHSSSVMRSRVVLRVVTVSMLRSW